MSDTIKVVGNSPFSRCSNCGKWVKLNKFIFGSLHLCLTDEEREKKRLLDRIKGGS